MSLSPKQIREALESELFSMLSNDNPYSNAQRVRYSMALASNYLYEVHEDQNYPTEKSKIKICSRMYRSVSTPYLWTAFMVFGNRVSPHKFGNEAISIEGTSFNTYNEIGYWSCFSRNSFYETEFKKHLTDDMLQISQYPRAFNCFSSDDHLTLEEQEAFVMERINETKEEIKREKNLKKKEEFRKQSEARRLEEDRIYGPERREQARKQEEIRKQEESRLLQEAKKIEEERESKKPKDWKRLRKRKKEKKPLIVY
ncbi:MAG: hypothetical protein H0U73_00825 [Tatlockia sp.]|nr:hypothetical protein [Tatlockia sp.]